MRCGRLSLERCRWVSCVRSGTQPVLEWWKGVALKGKTSKRHCCGLPFGLFEVFMGVKGQASVIEAPLCRLHREGIVYIGWIAQ